MLKWKIWFSELKSSTQMKQSLATSPHRIALTFVAQRCIVKERPETVNRKAYTVEETSPIEDAFKAAIVHLERKDSKSQWKLVSMEPHDLRNYANTEVLSAELSEDINKAIIDWWKKLIKDNKPHEITKFIKRAITTYLNLSNIGYITSEHNPQTI